MHELAPAPLSLDYPAEAFQVLYQFRWESTIRLLRCRAEPNRVMDGLSPMLRGDCHDPSGLAVTSERP